MKALFALTAASLISLSAHAGLSQSDARDLCEAEVQKTHADQSDFQFRRNSMSDYRRGSYTLMFNYRAQEAGETVSRKVKCVVAKEAGVIETLEVDSGRWNF